MNTGSGFPFSTAAAFMDYMKVCIVLILVLYHDIVIISIIFE
jgi:hypothetical protein